MPAKQSSRGSENKAAMKIKAPSFRRGRDSDTVETSCLPDDEADSPCGTTGIRSESMERVMRLRSARISAALWQRRSGSFSRALLIVSSSL